MAGLIRGRVSPEGIPVVPLCVKLGSRWRTFGAFLDTGFNGAVALPLDHARRAARRPVGYDHAELADGRVVREPLFSIEIDWGNERIRQFAVGTRGGHVLVGTALLRPSRVQIDFPTGTVLILPSRAARRRR